jgi:hypothetical protein
MRREVKLSKEDTSETLAPAGDNQAEVLFKSGTKFKIVSVEKSPKGIYEIQMIEK